MEIIEINNRVIWYNHAFDMANKQSTGSYKNIRFGTFVEEVRISHSTEKCIPQRATFLLCDQDLKFLPPTQNASSCSICQLLAPKIEKKNSKQSRITRISSELMVLASSTRQDICYNLFLYDKDINVCTVRPTIIGWDILHLGLDW